MEKIYDLTNEADLKQWNDEVDADIALQNSYKEITIINPSKELIAVKVIGDQSIILDASEYPNGKELLAEYKANYEAGKVRCKVETIDDLMAELSYRDGQIIYFTSDLMRDFLLSNLTNYSLVYGLPVEFQDEDVEEAVNAVKEFAINGEIDIDAMSKELPNNPQTAGLINIPTKYRSLYTQAKVIATYLKSLPFMKAVPVDMIIKVLDRLEAIGVFEFKDAPRDEFIEWLKGKL